MVSMLTTSCRRNANLVYADDRLIIGMLPVSLVQFGGVLRKMNEVGNPAGQCNKQERVY